MAAQLTAAVIAAGPSAPAPAAATAESAAAAAAPQPAAAPTAEADSTQPNAQPSAARLAELAEKREEAELEQRALRERHELPKTIDGFRKSKAYILERHVTRSQGLAPGAKRLGMHRGESYYDRASVSDLHSADRWRREGRQVLAWERANPTKTVAPRGTKGASGKAAAVVPTPAEKGGGRRARGAFPAHSEEGCSFHRPILCPRKPWPRSSAVLKWLCCCGRNLCGANSG